MPKLKISLADPIHAMERDGSLNIVELLLERGADIRYRTGQDKSAIDIAIQMVKRSQKDEYKDGRILKMLVNSSILNQVRLSDKDIAALVKNRLMTVAKYDKVYKSYAEKRQAIIESVTSIPQAPAAIIRAYLGNQ